VIGDEGRRALNKSGPQRRELGTVKFPYGMCHDARHEQTTSELHAVPRGQPISNHHAAWPKAA
jgi:hypothetical protein